MSVLKVMERCGRAGLLLCGLLASVQLDAQNPDSLRERQLEPIEIHARGSFGGFSPLPARGGVFLLSGIKSETVTLDSTESVLADKLARQVLAKVPGLMVYDMDGTGNQVNIAVRGLDPHRGWEFNQRVDGLLANSDLFGYPASHLSLPWEAVERIELVRGTAALQYGSQLGGLLQYHTRQPPVGQALAVESVSGLGSFGLVSTYLSAGGRQGRWRYGGYLSRRSSTGYRQNSRSQTEGQGLNLGVDLGAGVSVDLSWHHSYYLYQLPGPLTDAQFAADPRQATRARNYYSPDIHLVGLRLGWQLRSTTRLQVLASTLVGDRNSVLFDRPATVADTIDRQTGSFAPRQVDIDRYQSRTFEVRLTHRYALLGDSATLACGIQYLNNRMTRWQQGRGTTGSDYDLQLVEPGWGRWIEMRTGHGAVFVQNRFPVGARLGLTPGLRYERGRSNLAWQLRNYPAESLPDGFDRNFLLGGLALDFRINAASELYAGWAQSYRPVLLKEWVPGSVFERIDPNLRDGRGSNAELGWRGQWADWQWDVNAFWIEYRNRIGTLVAPDGGSFELLRTNTGNSRTYGLELYLERQFRLLPYLTVNLFTATAWMDGRYTGGELRQASGENAGLKGRRLEGVSNWSSRNGARLRWRQLSASVLLSTVSGHYADPFNTRVANASGTVGWVPDYTLLDLNVSWSPWPRLSLQLTANNVLNRAYFTKRPTFYPGPGIWPSDGRSFAAYVRFRF